MEKFKLLKRNQTSKLPASAGVYAFFGQKKVLYIGKAVNLKERVKQHQEPFSLNSQIGYLKTDSEIEALLLEAKLIKKYQPKYNVAWKDDKNYFFVAVTKEAFPQVFITHQPKNVRSRTSIIGPFVDGNALKQVLKVLRKVFPFRTCRRLPKHTCLWYHLRRCPGPCLFQSKLAKQIERSSASLSFPTAYRKNIQNLVQFLRDGKTRLVKNMVKEMKRLSQEEKYEEAAKIRNQIIALEKVISHLRVFEMIEVRLRTKIRWPYRRIEAYDVSNIQGKMATGAMVVFIDGQPDKSQYRKFRIKGKQKPNDIAMLKEVLSRRLNHQEWPYPDLILIDGGKAQLNVAKEVCAKFGSEQIKLAALAKKENKLYWEGGKKPILLKTMPREIFNLLLQLRDEAHRFARTYHLKLREKSLLN